MAVTHNQRKNLICYMKHEVSKIRVASSELEQSMCILLIQSSFLLSVPLCLC